MRPYRAAGILFSCKSLSFLDATANGSGGFTFGLVTAIPGSTGFGGSSISANGSDIAYISGANIFTYDVATAVSTQITAANDLSYSPAIAPDNQVTLLP